MQRESGITRTRQACAGNGTTKEIFEAAIQNVHSTKKVMSIAGINV